MVNNMKLTKLERSVLEALLEKTPRGEFTKYDFFQAVSAGKWEVGKCKIEK